MTAIRFAEWILQSGYYPVGIHKDEKKWQSSRVGSELLTTIQLYSLFLEHKDKAHEENT